MSLSTTITAEITKHELAHTVEFSTAEYVRSHGREPRGRGCWAFFPFGKSDIADAVFVAGQNTLTEAKKIAAHHFAANGVTLVEVGS